MMTMMRPRVFCHVSFALELRTTDTKLDIQFATLSCETASAESLSFAERM